MQLTLNQRYYDLMVRLALHQDDYLATTKHYLAVYRTPRIQESTDQARGVLQNVLIFIVLSPYGNEQSDLLARVVREDPVKNNQMGWVGGFVKRFTDGELMRCVFQFSIPVELTSGIDGLWCNTFMARNYVKRISLLSTKAMGKVK